MSKIGEAFSKFFTIQNWKKIIGLIITIVILIGLAIGLPMLLCSKPIPPVTTEANPQQTQQIQPQQGLIDTLNDMIDDMLGKKKSKR